MSPDRARHEFSAEEITELLGELDERLQERGASGSIFIVGGAAIAVITGKSPRRTEDVDAISHDAVVFDEAREMAEERGLPANWLNSAAAMWMPPLPPDSLGPPSRPGLRITYADDEFLLATKLVAQRRKDAPDLTLLADRLGLVKPSAEYLEEVIRRYYTDAGALEFIIDGQDIDGEITLLAHQAAAMLARSST